MFLRVPGLRLVDGVFGAVLTASVALGIAWIVGAVASSPRGRRCCASDIQRSAILQELNQLLPPSGPFLNALARIDPLPSVRGPEADVAPPTRGILATRGVKHAGPSVVKVLGTACGLGIEGSGWVAAPGVVVTNAHVVAGETDTTVQVGGNPPGLDADVIDFDPHDDIAVLRVPGLNEPVLKLAQNPKPGTAAAILGYPLDGGVRRRARADRPDRDRKHRGRVRQRAGDAKHHRAARARPPRQLRRPDDRPPRTGSRDRVCGDHRLDRRPRRLRSPELARPAQLAKAQNQTTPVSTESCAGWGGRAGPAGRDIAPRCARSRPQEARICSQGRARCRSERTRA